MFKFHTFLIRHKALASIALVFFIGLITFLASSINLEEDVSNLIPSGEKQEVLKRVLDHTDFADKIIITISSVSEDPNPEALTQFSQQFLDSLQLHLPEYISDIQGKVPEDEIREIYNFVYNNLPIFLSESDYMEIEKRLPRDSIRERLGRNYKNLISPTGLVTKEFIFKDPLSLTGLGLRKLEELQVEDDFELYNNFLISKDHRNVILFLSLALPASETDKNSFFIERLDRIQQNLNREFPGVRGDYFGGVLYSIANARQIKDDIRITLGIAGAILLLILIFYYRKIYVPLLIFIPSIIGGLTAIAVLYLLKGTVSAISLGIGAVLLGISIDYSLHILTHFKNNRDIRKLYKDVTAPVLMSSTTTAIAFLCLLFLKSEALNDLGLFAAISVLVASVFALILIPAFYTTSKKESPDTTIIDKVAAKDFHRNMPLVFLLFLLFLSGLFFFTRVEFNNDLSVLNYEPGEIQKKEENVQRIAGRAAKSIFLVSYGNSIDEALENNNSLYRELKPLEERGEINSFSSIGGVILSTNTQLARIEQWKEFWGENRRTDVRQILVEESSNFGFKPQSFESFYDLLTKDFEPVFLEDYRNISSLYLDDFITAGENFATVTTSVNLKSENLPAILQDLQENENVVIIDRRELNESFLGNLKNEFNRLIGFSLIAVFFVLLIFFRSLELTLLTLIPIGITWVITLGLLAVFNVQFNILNIIISTFIFGLGLDYSIFITNAFLREYETGIKVLKTYRTSILLSVITTLLGIGALFFAEHPALRSISIVSIIGIVVAVLVAFVIQGYIFQILFLNRKAEGKEPFSFKGFFNTSRYRERHKLYYRREVYDNYRYKKDLSEVKVEFEKERERFLKVSEFIVEPDKILHYPSEKGILPIFLHYKTAAARITGIEPDPEKRNVALNCFSSKSHKLNFIDDLPEDAGIYNVFILSAAPLGFEQELKKLVNSTVKKVIILDPQYSYRWILDYNFEIKYRQNDVVLLQKVD